MCSKGLFLLKSKIALFTFEIYFGCSSKPLSSIQTCCCHSGESIFGFWVVWASYVPFRSLYQIVNVQFCFGKRSGLCVFYEWDCLVLTAYRQQIFSFTTATARSSSFGYKLKVWCSFHWIEKLKEYLVYCITGWPDRRLDYKPKILILLICPCLRLELYLLQNVSLCHFNGNDKFSLIRGEINGWKWNEVYRDAFEQ